MIASTHEAMAVLSNQMTSMYRNEAGNTTAMMAAIRDEIRDLRGDIKQEQEALDGTYSSQIDMTKGGVIALNKAVDRCMNAFPNNNNSEL